MDTVYEFGLECIDRTFVAGYQSIIAKIRDKSTALYIFFIKFPALRVSSPLPKSEKKSSLNVEDDDVVNYRRSCYIPAVGLKTYAGVAPPGLGGASKKNNLPNIII